MNPAARSQLWLATLGAVVALGAAAIPATIQLFDEDSPPTAVPAVAPPAPTTTTTATEPTGGGRGGNRGGNDGARGGGP